MGTSRRRDQFSVYEEVFSDRSAPARSLRLYATGTQLAHLLKRMVERVHGRDSFSDALERTLDMGVTLPAIARLTPMTTRDGDVRVEIVVATAPTSR